MFIGMWQVTACKDDVSSKAANGCLKELCYDNNSLWL